jgi:hypothetical protein
MRKVNIFVLLGGDADRFAQFRRHTMPKILGWGFLAAGVFMIIAGLTAR